MKKLMCSKIVGIALFVSISVVAYGQRGSYIELIANPGLSMGGDFQVPNHIAGSDLYSSLPKSATFGINLGAAFGVHFTDQMGISLGISYAHQGQKYANFNWNDAGMDLTWERSVSLNYFKVPILFNFVAAPDKKISFRGSAGFYFSFLTGYKDENTISAADGSSLSTTASGNGLTILYMDNGDVGGEMATFLSKPFNSSDLGGIIAGGIQIQLTDKLTMPLMINYQVGFNDVKNKSAIHTETSFGSSVLFWQGLFPGNSPNTTLPYKNSSIGLHIGLKIRL